MINSNKIKMTKPVLFPAYPHPFLPPTALLTPYPFLTPVISSTIYVSVKKCHFNKLNLTTEFIYFYCEFCCYEMERWIFIK